MRLSMNNLNITRKDLVVGEKLLEQGGKVTSVTIQSVGLEGKEYSKSQSANSRVSVKLKVLMAK